MGYNERGTINTTKDSSFYMEKQHMDEWSINGIPGYLSNVQDDRRNTDYNLGETTTPKSTLWEESWKVKPTQPAPTISAFLWAQDI